MSSTDLQVSSKTEERFSNTATKRRMVRWEPLTGFAFVVFFLGSVVASTVPANTAPDKDWVAAFTGHAHQFQHFVTGVLLVLAAMSLLSFLTVLWTRISAARRPIPVSPLPLVAAGVSAACIAAGGVLMAGISGSTLFFSQPLPGVDVMRLGNDLGFAMVSLGGMVAAALSVSCLSVQARSAGLFGRKLAVFGLVVAVLLLGAIAFLPIVALLIWLMVASVTLMRSRAGE